MQIKPLAFDSLGVRSEATFVETSDVKILIDPGAALGPRRYSLPPHKLEYEKLAELTEAIRNHAKSSDILIITHYHYDHYTPSEPELCKDKILLIKHPKENINKSQQQRAKDFLENINQLPKEIHYADNKEFEFGNTRIKFSPAVYHGKPGTRIGFVIMVSISDGKESFIFGSDAQGPIDDKAKDWIIKENPDLAVIDGSISYMLGFRLAKKDLLHGLENLAQILEETKVKKVIYDHHLVRDLYYKRRLSENSTIAKEIGNKIITAAEFLGKEPNFLEANRKKLHEKLHEND